MTQESMKLYYYDAGWNQYADIVTYPTISKRMDNVSNCTVVLRDFEGAKYSTWEPRDFTKMKVEDSSSNVLFTGYLKKKTFGESTLTLELVGFASKLDWTPFRKNFILTEGLVKASPYLGTDVPGLTETVAPNAEDTANNATFGAGASNLARLIDDSDSTGIYYSFADHGLGGQTDIYDFPDLTGTYSSVTAVAITIRAKDNETGGADVDISFDGGVGWEGAQVISVGTDYENDVITFSGLAENDFSDFQLRIRTFSVDANDYVYVSEIVDVTVTYAGSTSEALELKQDDEDAGNPDFAWASDYWITDQDVGILIEDQSDTNTQTWQITAISTDKDEIAGNAASTQTENDGDFYHAQQTNDDTALTVTTTVTGVNISTSCTPLKITVYYKYGVYYDANPSMFGKVKLQVKKDTTWTTLRTVTTTAPSGGNRTDWISGSVDITEDLDDYLKDSEPDDDWDQLQGLRFYIDEINYSGATSLIAVKVDYISVVIEYSQYDISPVMEQVDYNGASYVRVVGVNWGQSGVAVNDKFRMGENTSKIISEISATVGIPFEIVSTLSKYMARHFKGSNCMDALKSIKELEAVHWIEDHSNERILISTVADLTDSGVDLTDANYNREWVYEDDCNHFKGVEVFGNASLSIYAIAENPGSTSLMYKQVVDDQIMTNADAQDIADNLLTELTSKQPSIKVTIPFNSSIDITKTVDLTLARPTVAKATYPIRRMDVFRVGEDLFQTLYLGMGSTPPEEKLADFIRTLSFKAHKSLTDRLVNTPLGAGATITSSDIADFTTAAQAAVVESAAYGAGWNGDNSHSPSQDAVYDKINAMDATIAAIITPAWTNADNHFQMENAFMWMEDGYTNANLQAAIDLLEANGGGIIYLPEGTMTITAQVTITGPVQLIGTGEGTIIAGNVADYIIDVQGNGARLSRIKFDVSGGADNKGIEINGDRNVIDGCYFVGSHGNDIHVYLAAGATHNYVMYNFMTSGQYGINFNDDYNYCFGNTITDYDGGIYLSSGATYCNVKGNILYNNDTYDIVLDEADYNNVIGNQCDSGIANEILLSANADENVVVGNQATVVDNGANNVVANNNA